MNQTGVCARLHGGCPRCFIGAPATARPRKHYHNGNAKIVGVSRLKDGRFYIIDGTGKRRYLRDWREARATCKLLNTRKKLPTEEVKQWYHARPLFAVHESKFYNPLLNQDDVNYIFVATQTPT